MNPSHFLMPMFLSSDLQSVFPKVIGERRLLLNTWSTIFIGSRSLEVRCDIYGDMAVTRSCCKTGRRICQAQGEAAISLWSFFSCREAVQSAYVTDSVNRDFCNDNK